MIRNLDGGTVALRGFSITGGLEMLGGGIYNGSENSEMTLFESAVFGNTATFAGGGILNASGASLVVSNSSIYENLSQDFGAGLENNGSSSTANISHTTITGNRAVLVVGGLGSTASEGVVIKNSIVAGNSAPAIPDTGKFDGFTSNGANLIGNNSGGDIQFPAGMPNADGNFVGTAAAPLDNFLSPPGDYGGPTPTLLPIPGSPAIDAASLSGRITDQRGFAIAGLPDIGAAEFQGGDDFGFIWETDGDGDGSPFGIEYALGTDPAVSDVADARNPILTENASGNPQYDFGLNGAAASGTIWRITRSPDLSEGSFMEIYRFDGTIDTTATDISSSRTPDSISVTDQNPLPGKAFYRFEAVPPQ